MKKILLYILLVFSALTLFGCSDNSTSKDETPTNPDVSVPDGNDDEDDEVVPQKHPYSGNYDELQRKGRARQCHQPWHRNRRGHYWCCIDAGKRHASPHSC